MTGCGVARGARHALWRRGVCVWRVCVCVCVSVCVCVRASWQLSRIQLEMESCKSMLTAALEDLGILDEENKSLGEHIRDLVANYEEVQRTRDELQAELDSLRSSAKADACRCDCATSSASARDRAACARRSLSSRSIAAA